AQRPEDVTRCGKLAPRIRKPGTRSQPFRDPCTTSVTSLIHTLKLFFPDRRNRISESRGKFMPEPPRQNLALREQALTFLKRCPDCAVIFDKDWTVTWANPAFEERFCTRKAEGSNFLSFL